MTTPGTFPAPKDVRTARDFDIDMGQDELLRVSGSMFDSTKGVIIGEWLKPKAGNAWAKLEVGVDTLAAPPRGAKVSWTLYVPGDPFLGQSDAMATLTLDVLSGTFKAATKFYNTGSGFLQPGNLLVAVYDASIGGGILDAPDPAAITKAQIAAAVGRLVIVDSGILHFESPR